jgi:peptide subunit release factor 1 (eRF1)
VGVEDTLKAFELGQVDELLITGMPDALDAGASADATRAPADRTPEERAADALIAQARQTSARIRFVQDPALLAAVGGAAAFLRFKL